MSQSLISYLQNKFHHIFFKTGSSCENLMDEISQKMRIVLVYLSKQTQSSPKPLANFLQKMCQLTLLCLYAASWLSILMFDSFTEIVSRSATLYVLSC